MSLQIDMRQVVLLIASAVDLVGVDDVLHGRRVGMSAGKISLESRIIKVADIYQALSQNRPYRGPLPAATILSLLRQMQADLEVDPQLIEFVAQNLDACHQATIGPCSVDITNAY